MELPSRQMDWRDRLREAIDATGMQRKAFAARAGVPESSLSRLLNEPEKDPQLSTVLPVLRAAGISLDALIDDGAVPATTITPYDAKPEYRSLIDTLERLTDADRLRIVEFAGWVASAVTRTHPPNTKRPARAVRHVGIDVHPKAGRLPLPVGLRDDVAALGEEPDDAPKTSVSGGGGTPPGKGRGR